MTPARFFIIGQLWDIPHYMLSGSTLELIRTVAIGIQALVVVAAMIGVFLTKKQVKLTRNQVELRKDQATTEFENQLAREYRNISREIPVEALLGEKISESKYKKNLKHFHSYIDLSNEQIFLRFQGRVSKETWKNWSDGIESHLDRVAFERAWKDIKNRSETEGRENFSELRRLENEDFDSDPYDWDVID